jgi:hypothetical protein
LKKKTNQYSENSENDQSKGIHILLRKTVSFGIFMACLHDDNEPIYERLITQEISSLINGSSGIISVSSLTGQSEKSLFFWQPLIAAQ